MLSKIDQNAALISASANLGTLAITLRQRWMRQRWRRLWRKVVSNAEIRPGAPSEMPTSGGRSPRSLSSPRKWAHASVDSDPAGARPMKTGLPPVVMPQAHRLGRGVGIHAEV